MSGLFKSPALWDLSGQAPVYMVFKYIPNPIRLEPRNIGVMLWHKGAIVAKFLPKTPKFIESDGIYSPEHIYSVWIDFWGKELTKHEIVSATKGGAPVHVTSVQFLQVLQDGNRPNFNVVLGGEILNPGHEVQYVTEHIEELYQRIVA